MGTVGYPQLQEWSTSLQLVSLCIHVFFSRLLRIGLLMVSPCPAHGGGALPCAPFPIPPHWLVLAGWITQPTHTFDPKGCAAGTGHRRSSGSLHTTHCR